MTATQNAFLLYFFVYCAISFQYLSMQNIALKWKILLYRKRKPIYEAENKQLKNTLQLNLIQMILCYWCCLL